MKRRRAQLLLLVAVALVAAGLALLPLLGLPDPGELSTLRPSTTAYMQRYTERTGREPNWHWVPTSQISPSLKRAVLVSEDINFFSHDGFDQGEIGAALKQAWAEKELPRGASTLTQQLARNLYLSPTRNPLRKLREAVVTRRIEAALGKRRILEIYLNVVEFGPGLYGAEAASWHYFGQPAVALDDSQAAQLAAVLPRPSQWHPGRTTPGYTAAVERILRRMDKATFLDRLVAP